MQCPHCGVGLRYRERGNKTCSTCKQKFAFEPKTNPLGMHDVLFRKTIDQLGQNGQYKYTASQLLYRAGRKVARSASRSTIGGCIGGTILGAIIIGIMLTGMSSNLLIGMGLGILLFLFLIPFAVMSGTRAFEYKLPVDLPRFLRDFVQHWYGHYNTWPQGLLSSQELEKLPQTPPDPQQVRAVIACPQRDVLVSLRANRLPERLNVQLIPTEPPFTPTEEAVRVRLQNQPDLPLLLLHDASPAGMLLHRTVLQSLGLRAYHDIIDLGIRPRDAIEHKMMVLGAKPKSQMLQALRKQMQQGAQQSGFQPLSDAEYKWLEKGNYTPILSVTPARLIRVVTPAVQRVAGRRTLPTPRDPEQQAQQAAQAVGFMSWPAPQQ